jgi:hypothetical protein
MHWEMRNTYMCFAGKAEEKRQFRRQEQKCEDNIKLNFKERGCEGVNCYKLADDMFQWWVHMNDHSGSIKTGNFVISLTTMNCSRTALLQDVTCLLIIINCT